MTRCKYDDIFQNFVQWGICSHDCSKTLNKELFRDFFLMILQYKTIAIAIQWGNVPNSGKKNWHSRRCYKLYSILSHYHKL